MIRATRRGLWGGAPCLQPTGVGIHCPEFLRRGQNRSICAPVLGCARAAVITLLRSGKHVAEPGRQGGAAEGLAPCRSKGLGLVLDHGDPWLIFTWGLSCTWEGRQAGGWEARPEALSKAGSS